MTYSIPYNILACEHVIFEFDVEDLTFEYAGDQMIFSMEVLEMVHPVIATELSEKKRGVNHKKRNKIINSSYKSGDNLKGEDYKFEHELKVDPVYASANLGHLYDVENNVVYKRVQSEVIKLIDNNAELREMTDDMSPNHTKFNREKTNALFKIIYDHFQSKPELSQFCNVIYILDNVSNLSGLKYASLYDMLNTEYQQMLLLELHNQYGILDTNSKYNKLF